ncbi:MAG TPA: hypothetical protein VEI97_08645, partial [bacterium]|nr:hypothetical protein [bacterium]
MIGQETVSRIVVPSSSVAPAPIEALRHAGLGRSLGDLEPWDAWLLGPDAPEITTLVRDSLAPWLATIPHSRDMPRWLLTFPGTAPDRSFPAPLGVLWPADLGWRPILNPWSDPGGGVALVELLGDHHELKDVLKELVQRFYTGLVLDPPGVGGLLHEACDDI